VRWLLALAAWLALAAPAQAYRGPVPILTYHDLRPAPDGRAASIFVAPARFRAQLRALHRAGYHGVTLSQAWAGWHGGPALPAKPLVVSFDDGYAAQYTVAGPALERLHWPGLINLETARIGAGLSEARVRALLGRGWELASHTLTHPDLRKVTAAQRTREIAGSRTTLRRLFDVPVNFFCYPYGRDDAAVRAAVAAAGYTGATTIASGIASPASARLQLPRIVVRAGTTPAQLLKRLRG
jgi:peptidoglycan/xylan/chitin deacetylase (PgdA/CDA1 family)